MDIAISLTQIILSAMVATPFMAAVATTFLMPEPIMTFFMVKQVLTNSEAMLATTAFMVALTTIHSLAVSVTILYTGKEKTIL